jgi:pre-mRNA-processing factor 17
MIPAKEQFYGSQLHDYQGRTYMHVPLDLDIDLRGDKNNAKAYWPKKLLHTWKEHQDI